MKKLVLLLFVLFVIISLGNCQSIPESDLYLGQTPPGNTPKVFDLSVTSGLRPVERITISSDGKEIYYCEINTWPASVKRIKCFKYVDNTWQGPTDVFEGYMCPSISINDSIMYMQNDLAGIATTFYSIRTETGWSIPARLLSTNLQSHYFQETQMENFYLASTPNGNSDISKLKIQNSDTIVQSLGKPINNSSTENDFFIARDESYIIFFRLSNPYDLFISYNKGDSAWTNPKSLGININTSIYECCPYVTNDNKFLFFTRGGNDMESYSTYWVKIDNIIDSLKHTNFVPYLNNSISNQTDSVGNLFTFTIPDSIFIDDDGNNTLTYSATLNNGNALPSWLTFDTNTRSFSGTLTEAGSFIIKVKATDTEQASISCTFTLKVEQNKPNAIDQINGQNIQIYPNPTNGLLNVNFDFISNKTATIEIFDMLGKSIYSNSFQNFNSTTIDLNNKPLGFYILKVTIDSIVVNKKFCFEN